MSLWCSSYSNHLLSSYYTPGTLLSALRTFFCLILTSVLQRRFVQPHVTEEKNEGQTCQNLYKEIIELVSSGILELVRPICLS